MKKLSSIFRLKTAAGELNLFSFFAILTTIPTIIAVIYYSLLASDIFVSETQFSIYNNEPTSTGIDLGEISQLTSGNIKSESLEQLLMAAEYIKSYDLLVKIDEQLNLKRIYSDRNIDFYSRLKAKPSKRQFLKYYQNMISVKVNREASIIYVTAKAFTAEDAFKITNKINEFTEDFINGMLARVKKDVLMEAEFFIDKSQRKIKNIQGKLSEFRIRNTTLDPAEELNAKLEFIRALETKKAEFLIEKNEKKSLLSGKSIPMKSLQNKISNIDAMIADTRSEILKFAEEGGDILREYGMLILDEEFAKGEYKLALLNLEETLKNQGRINKYVVEILKPTIPDIASEPNRLRKIITVFIFSFIFSGILGLVISGVRDHIIT